MSQSTELYRLQKLDLEIDTRRSRVRDITAALEDDNVLRQVQADVTALQEKLRPNETHIIDLNLELQTVATQTTQLTDRLYGGTVSNPKELEDIQGKIAERKRRRGVLEDDLLETMITVEDLQKSLAETTQLLDDVETRWTTEQRALNDEMKRLKQELKALKADREVAVEAVEKKTLELYQTLRVRKQGHAVAALDGLACSVCRVDQTTTLAQRVRQGNELITCPNCGRILVAV